MRHRMISHRRKVGSPRVEDDCQPRPVFDGARCEEVPPEPRSPVASGGGQPSRSRAPTARLNSRWVGEGRSARTGLNAQAPIKPCRSRFDGGFGMARDGIEPPTRGFSVPYQLGAHQKHRGKPRAMHECLLRRGSLDPPSTRCRTPFGRGLRRKVQWTRPPLITRSSFGMMIRQ